MLTLNSQLRADVSLKETQYDQRINVVHAVDEVWERLFKENAFFRAYYHEGEPAFMQMCNLFGIHDVKTELSHTIILIEDSTTVKKQPDSSDDEVTSPIPKPVAAKKLSVDDACSSVAPSGPNPFKGSKANPWKSIKNKFHRPSPPRVRIKDDRDPSTGYGESSCASSLPFK
ncbi:uncharacterized protein LOC131006575 [Salvia miltiorrhiza]|uniref:uncharacterized protein LOC131006575 n=1 Tax=Salvia miltiorrhiza TaxID=226208 RepID=UPI0025AC3703|nr:uncharacterized protein LOC131006575 [Salvia miltiorrhiza]